jgi:hypothetical protein
MDIKELPKSFRMIDKNRNCKNCEHLLICSVKHCCLHQVALPDIPIDSCVCDDFLSKIVEGK